jgi:hypothetical protein
MVTALVLLVIVGLVVYGLERNHARESVPRQHFAGSSAVVDRDLARVLTEVRAAADRPFRRGTCLRRSDFDRVA